MRYPCLEQLLKSVQRFYPDLRVFIADDTPSHLFQEIDRKLYPNAYQYKMPSNSGWFPGRALVISQVSTEYFLWVDDDFIIRSKTDLRFMLKVIQQTGYDVIGAGVSRSGESH